MTIWIVIIEDRHADAEVLPFTGNTLAIEAACAWAEGCSGDATEVELTKAMAGDGWVLCLEYGTEGDRVRVVKRTLDG